MDFKNLYPWHKNKTVFIGVLLKMKKIALFLSLSLLLLPLTAQDNNEDSYLGLTLQTYMRAMNRVNSRIPSVAFFREDVTSDDEHTRFSHRNNAVGFMTTGSFHTQNIETISIFISNGPTATEVQSWKRLILASLRLLMPQLGELDHALILQRAVNADGEVYSQDGLDFTAKTGSEYTVFTISQTGVSVPAI